MGRPATVKEINAGLDKNQIVYDYLQDISKTAEFQKNGKTLYEVLSTKAKDLSADDGNFNMSNLANLLIAASENPQNDKQTAFSNQVLVSVATGNDMLENPENAASYEAKLALSGGLKQVFAIRYLVVGCLTFSMKFLISISLISFAESCKNLLIVIFLPVAELMLVSLNNLESGSKNARLIKDFSALLFFLSSLNFFEFEI